MTDMIRRVALALQLGLGLLIATSAVRAEAADAPNPVLPERISVLPVFIVPQGEAVPTRVQKVKLLRHLKWAQQWYQDHLPGEVTFRLEEEILTHRSPRPLAYYRGLPKSEPAGAWAGELLDRLETDRFSCPHVLLTVVMNPAERFPIGGGRPLNGGYDTGGGIIVFSSFALDRLPNFQSTLRHEFGHSFGLPHVDTYRYDMQTNASVMSYNPAHKTRGFEEGTAPPELIPEDLRGLALNDRALDDLEFDPRRDVPADYELFARAVWLGPLKIPGQPDYHIEASSTAETLHGSEVQNTVLGRIEPSAGPGVKFNRGSMWEAQTDANGWIPLELTFPVPVELDRIVVHSEHSGRYNKALAVRVQAANEGTVEVDAGEEFRDVTTAPLSAADAAVRFRPTKAERWRLFFQAGPNGRVVIRGLQFYAGEDELFPPLIPPGDEVRPAE
jgi:hypothetical protein